VSISGALPKVFLGRDEKRKGVPLKVNDHTELKMKKLFLITEQGVTNPVTYLFSHDLFHYKNRS